MAIDYMAVSTKLVNTANNINKRFMTDISSAVTTAGGSMTSFDLYKSAALYHSMPTLMVARLLDIGESGSGATYKTTKFPIDRATITFGKNIRPNTVETNPANVVGLLAHPDFRLDWRQFPFTQLSQWISWIWVENHTNSGAGTDVLGWFVFTLKTNNIYCVTVYRDGTPPQGWYADPVAGLSAPTVTQCLLIPLYTGVSFVVNTGTDQSPVYTGYKLNLLTKTYAIDATVVPGTTELRALYSSGGIQGAVVTPLYITSAYCGALIQLGSTIYVVRPGSYPGGSPAVYLAWKYIFTDSAFPGFARITGVSYTFMGISVHCINNDGTTKTLRYLTNNSAQTLFTLPTSWVDLKTPTNLEIYSMTMATNYPSSPYIMATAQGLVLSKGDDFNLETFSDYHKLPLDSRYIDFVRTAELLQAEVSNTPMMVGLDLRNVSVIQSGALRPVRPRMIYGSIVIKQCNTNENTVVFDIPYFNARIDSSIGFGRTTGQLIYICARDTDTHHYFKFWGATTAKNPTGTNISEDLKTANAKQFPLPIVDQGYRHGAAVFSKSNANTELDQDYCTIATNTTGLAVRFTRSNRILTGEYNDIIFDIWVI